MTPEPKPIATLPELEWLLSDAAARRFAPRTRRRPWALPLAFAALLVAGGIATAATGVLGGGAEIETGATSSGPYAIRIKPANHYPPSGPICLQLQYTGLRPAYKCGYAPSAERPFGLVVADATPAANDPEAVPPERVIYGLASEETVRVQVLGVAGADATEAITDTVIRPGLPGRYFSIVVPNQGRIELVGYDESGGEVGRAGSLTAPAQRTADGLIPAPGDPAVFAPTATPASVYSYRGEDIDPKRAQELGLVCVEDLAEVRCYDSVGELNAAEPGDPFETPESAARAARRQDPH